ncbi:MAG TPA: LysM domain-containing protein [Thiothrix sp.]|nr:LysM domain-containing protein [Thiothrix sp.]
MFKNIKYLAAISFAAMVVSGCTTAPAPWANPSYNQNQARGNVRPPAPARVQGGTAHQHGTVVHTHPLPAQGIHHTHQYGSGAGISGRAVGSAGQQAQPAPVRQPQPQYQPQRQPQQPPQQNQSQTYGYGYGNNNGGYNAGSQSPYDGSSNPYNSGNNNYGGGNTNNNTKPSTGGYYGDIGGNNNTNSSSSYGGGSSSSSSSYGGSSSSSGGSYDGGSSTYDTSTYGGSSSSSSSNLDDIRDPNYRDGDTYYTVQKGNTVFAVMRITGAYWKDVVKWNDLVAPKYTIHPGQRLRVK